MLRLLVIFLILLGGILPALAQENIEDKHFKPIRVQQCIDNVAFDILNANRIDKRVIFTYYENDAKKISLNDKTITKRNVVIYKNQINHVSDVNELSAFLSREISKAALSYDGFARGFVTSAQMKFAPKKYELFFDKRGVDLMVKAGYNPIAMIIYLNKLNDQKRFSCAFTNNKTSVRMAEVYEYIYFKYPEFLANNSYIENKFYQNFLLTSEKNRHLLSEKVKEKSKKRLKYE